MVYHYERSSNGGNGLAKVKVMSGIEEEKDEVCFGEYGQFEYCHECYLRDRCKKFTEAERNVAIRYQGKYTGKGKEKRKDKY